MIAGIVDEDRDPPDVAPNRGGKRVTGRPVVTFAGETTASPPTALATRTARRH